MATRRNRRQRKKLRTGEFQELGFSVFAELRSQLDHRQHDALLANFLEACIEANGMMFGGGIDNALEGYVTAEQERSSTTDQHREIVKAWIESRAEFWNVKVGPLSDAKRASVE